MVIKSFSHSLALLLITLSTITLCCSCSQPEPVSFVDDQAHLLSSKQIERLEKFHHLLLKEQDVEFHVITLEKPSDNLDQDTLEIFETRRIGERSLRARGLLLVIDPLKKQARIEVGYDLEGCLPDGLIAALQYDQMLPFFQNNRIGHGIEAITELLVNQLLEKTGDDPVNSAQQSHFSGGAGAKIHTDQPDPSDEKIDPASKRDYLPQLTPLGTLKQYRDSLQALNKNPNLSIYTPQSREFFRNWLVTDAQQMNALKTLDIVLTRGETIEQGETSAVRFPVKYRQAAPYFFKHSNSGWQLDFATMSRVIGFNHRNQWHFRSLDHVYSFAFEDWRFDANGFPHENK